MIPTEEGFYWAKWKIASEGTREGDDLTPSNEWEVMHVVENSNDPDDTNHLMVMVPGVEKWQPVENFFWAKQINRVMPKGHVSVAEEDLNTAEIFLHAMIGGASSLMPGDEAVIKSLLSRLSCAHSGKGSS